MSDVAYDPIGHRQAGMDTTRQLLNTFYTSRAGAQLARGDRTGAQQTFNRAGQFENASAVQTQDREAKARELQASLQIARALKGVREQGGDVVAALDSYRPVLNQFGVDEASFGNIRQLIATDPTALDKIEQMAGTQLAEWEVKEVGGDLIGYRQGPDGQFQTRTVFDAPDRPTIIPGVGVLLPPQGGQGQQAPMMPGQAPVTGPQIANNGLWSGGGSPASANPPAPEIGNRDAVIRLLVAEAGNQGPEGLAAAAAVIRNRSSQTGLSFSDIIAQPSQFEPMMTAAGQQRMADLDPNSPEYKAAADALDRVMAGYDPTGGADHFFSPTAQAALGRQNPSWASGDPSAVIGQHNFYQLGYGGGRPQAAQPQQQQQAQAQTGGVQPLGGGWGLQPIVTPAEQRAQAAAQRDEIRFNERNNPTPAQQEEASARTFTQERQIRSDYANNAAVKALGIVRPQLGIIADIAGRAQRGEEISAQDDLALIFSYMKMLDPGSVVREGEFANAQNTAGIPERVLNAYNNALSGTRLSDQQRNNFFRSADTVIQQYQSGADAAAARARQLAESYGLEPDRIAPVPRERRSEREQSPVRNVPQQLWATSSPQQQQYWQANPPSGGRGTQTNPLRLDPRDPRRSYGNVPRGSYYLGPDGQVRIKQ